MSKKIYNYEEIGKQIDTMFGIKLLKENVKADIDDLDYLIQECHCLVFNAFNKMHNPTKEEFDYEKYKIIDNFTSEKVKELKAKYLRNKLIKTSSYSMDSMNEDMKSIINYINNNTDCNAYIVHIMYPSDIYPTKIDVTKKILSDRFRDIDFDTAFDILNNMSTSRKEFIRDDMGIDVDQLISWIEHYLD